MAYSTYSLAIINSDGSVIGDAITDGTPPPFTNMNHTAYATATLTSPKGRKAVNNGQGTNTYRAEVVLSFDPTDLGTYLESSIHSAYCPCMGYFIHNVASGASATENPVISGPQTVWLFNTSSPSGYAVQITLSASPTGAGLYSWSITSGSDKVSLSGQSGNNINVVGKALSKATGDVGVTVTAGGATSSAYAITVFGPYLLVKNTPYATTTLNQGTWQTALQYVISDNFGSILPSPVPFNENWTSGLNYGSGYNSQNCNWPQAIAGGGTTPAQNPSDFYDLMLPPPLSGNPLPTPQGPGNGATLVVWWGQEWRVGSVTPGAGARVQTDYQQYYLDHGAHDSIVTPAP